MFVSAKQFMSNSVPTRYSCAIQIGKVFHMSQRSARNKRIGAALSLLIVLSACSSQPSHVSDAGQNASRVPPSVDSPSARAASIATAQVGVPYRYGGSSPSGFDCSGLVYFSYGQAGKSVPRTTSGLWLGAEPVGRGELRTGDVLFFRIEGKVSHVGMYLDDGQFVHAPASGRRVSVESLDSEFYRQAFIRGGRL
jgi:cell wall-associated NlpC family hydrolase